MCDLQQKHLTTNDKDLIKADVDMKINQAYEIPSLT